MDRKSGAPSEVEATIARLPLLWPAFQLRNRILNDRRSHHRFQNLVRGIDSLKMKEGINSPTDVRISGITFIESMRMESNYAIVFPTMFW